MSVWVQYIDITGNSSDYSVTDWESARLEAKRIISGWYLTILGEYEQRVADGLETEDWRSAVELFNETNGVHIFLRFYDKD